MKAYPSTEILLRIINQVYELEKKVSKLPDPKSLNRNLKRIISGFEELGFYIDMPIGEAYDETRTDCDASIVGPETQNLIIKEVIKPIIYLDHEGTKQIVQRGVVIAESQNEKRFL